MQVFGDRPAVFYVIVYDIKFFGKRKKFRCGAVLGDPDHHFKKFCVYNIAGRKPTEKPVNAIAIVDPFRYKPFKPLRIIDKRVEIAF